MKLVIYFTVLLTVQNSYASDKSIYGDDNRRLIKELSLFSQTIEKEQSRSVLAQVPQWRLSSFGYLQDSSYLAFQAKSLSRGMNFCVDEKFSELPIVSSCSAFLVAPDLILTAGHCINDQEECQNNFWILDYNDKEDFDELLGVITIKKSNVVSCSKLLLQSNTPHLDFALIKINKILIDRKPLLLRRSGKITSSAALEVIGHPMGLPKVLTNEARVLHNSLESTYTINADTFSGNSGSPVFDSKTHQVEGMLIRGSRDFQMDLDLGCNRAYHCQENECQGEVIQRSTALPLKLIPKI